MKRFATITTATAIGIGLAGGCAAPATHTLAGPQVYILDGGSGRGLELALQLKANRVNAAVYDSGNWLHVVTDIEKQPHLPVVLVGEGHGGFLAVEVARHFAHPVYRKQIRMLIAINPYDKDGFDRPSIPVPNNIDYVYNFQEKSALVSTRGTDVEAIGHEWRDLRVRLADGQRLQLQRPADADGSACLADLMDDVVLLCRRAVLNSYHWTPRSVHPYAGHPFIDGGTSPPAWPIEPT